MKDMIYMDYNATTPVSEKSYNSILPYLKGKFGNPSSKHHRFGLEADVAIEQAREQIASVIGADPKEIIFTSGATESINLAFKGIVESNFKENINIVTTEIEHKAVLDSCKSISDAGIEIRYAKPDKYGIVHLQNIENLFDNNTLFVSVMVANNEIGTIQPIAEIGELCSQKNIVFHTDATQAFGKIKLNVKDLKIDLMSFSSHKIYGPKGAGTLFINKNNKDIKLSKQISGGEQEMGLRGGTQNVPAIVGFGVAALESNDSMNEDFQKQIIFRDILTERFLKNLQYTYLNGHKTKRLPNTANICFEGVDSGSLMSKLKNIALSTGSACNSATLEPSYVLKAIGLDDKKIKSSVRFSIGRGTTQEEIDYVSEKVIQTVKELRN